MPLIFPPVVLSSARGASGRMKGKMDAGWINCAVLLLQFTHSSGPNRASSPSTPPARPLIPSSPSEFSAAKKAPFVFHHVSSSLCRVRLSLRSSSSIMFPPTNDADPPLRAQLTIISFYLGLERHLETKRCNECVSAHPNLPKMLF